MTGHAKNGVLRVLRGKDGFSESGPLLVCAATRFELATVLPRCGGRPPSREGVAKASGLPAVWYLVSGIGVPATFAFLPPVLEALRPRLVLNIGLAGAYRGSGLKIGEAVEVGSDVYGDVGFGLPGGGFRSIRDSALPSVHYSRPIPLVPAARAFPGVGLRKVRGCTVNTCTGTEAMGRLRRRAAAADIETMEGVAVAQAANSRGIPVVGIRSISNVAATREMRSENITLALAALERVLEKLRP